MTRIIAGSRGGRRLNTPPGVATRPTSDRVREALFSALTVWAGAADQPADQGLGGLAVVDLYAGSGAVGLEAASRGADPVLLVESDRRTAAVARGNAEALSLPVEVRTERVERLVATSAPRAFDIVFADPPYALPAQALDAVVAELARHGWLAADAVVVLERAGRDEAPSWPVGFESASVRHYGETSLYFAHAMPQESR
jgi:16S rRNA (guanine966-N2)-methyltransferase